MQDKCAHFVCLTGSSHACRLCCGMSVQCLHSAPACSRSVQATSSGTITKWDVQVLIHLVYGMAVRNLAASGMPDRASAVTALLSDLQAVPSAQLWPSETTTVDRPDNVTYPALRRLVRRLVESIFVEPELQVKWVRTYQTDVIQCNPILPTTMCHCADVADVKQHLVSRQLDRRMSFEVEYRTVCCCCSAKRH